MIVAAIAAAVSVVGQNAPDAKLWQETLQKYVDDRGGVKYAALHADLGSLNRYVGQIKAVSPDSHPALFPKREERLAYWLNAYNALVLRAFATEYPEGRDRLATKLGQFRFFYARKFEIGGKQRSLDDIETNSVRKAFGDPRIHFALVCASASCPWLSRDAFTADGLNRQLEERARLFVNQERNVSLNEKGKILTLSMIFKWYESDFGGRTGLMATLKKLDRQGRNLDQKNLRLQYRTYDWSLNDNKPAID